MREQLIAGTQDTSQDSTVAYLTEKEVAGLLRLAPGTIRNWRWNGIGPEYVKFGPRCVRYKRQEIDRFIADRNGR